MPSSSYSTDTNRHKDEQSSIAIDQMNLGKSATSLSRGHRFCLMEIPNMIQTGSSSIRWTPGYRHGGHNLISLIQTR
uniref:Uncharacterized protein n=1 Tax=Helianthus annuus TaxID=4232 RepID=A0A251TDJ6_HELAN